MIILQEKKQIKESNDGFVNSDAKKLLFTALSKEFRDDTINGGIPELALIGTVERAIRSIQGWMFMSYQNRLIGNTPEIQNLKRNLAKELNHMANRINSIFR
jgi:hypothetical protein